MSAPTPEPVTSSSRHEKSLGLLTTKFVGLLKSAQDGVLDLKMAADHLHVRQKRRIYDITNVLEGIGLIEKRTKNTIQWKGAGPECDNIDINSKIDDLKKEIERLEEEEAELDRLKQWTIQSIRNVTDDQDNTRMSYITHRDLVQSFPGNALLAIKAPCGTQLQVPSDPNRKYQLHLKSMNGQIDVILLNKDSSSSRSPVVVPVPPAPGNFPSGDFEIQNISNNVSRDLMLASKSAEMNENSFYDITCETLRPLLNLSPYRPEQDYCFNLDTTEGACDLFDIQL